MSKDVGLKAGILVSGIALSIALIIIGECALSGLGRTCMIAVGSGLGGGLLIGAGIYVLWKRHKTYENQLQQIMNWRPGEISREVAIEADLILRDAVFPYRNKEETAEFIWKEHEVILERARLILALPTECNAAGRVISTRKERRVYEDNLMIALQKKFGHDVVLLKFAITEHRKTYELGEKYRYLLRGNQLVLSFVEGIVKESEWMSTLNPALDRWTLAKEIGDEARQVMLSSREGIHFKQALEESVAKKIKSLVSEEERLEIERIMEMNRGTDIRDALGSARRIFEEREKIIRDHTDEAVELPQENELMREARERVDDFHHMRNARTGKKVRVGLKVA
jgi:hypothetical protein